jgi:hypothetical protein
MPHRRLAVKVPVAEDSKIKNHIIPVEIFSEIFVFVIQAAPRSQRNLMLVCRRWHNIMLSTPGNRSQLRIGRSTQKTEVEAVIRRSRSLLDVTVDITIGAPGYRLVEPEFHACFMVAAQAAPRWRSFELASLPPHGEYEYLQTLQPLQRLESFKLSHGSSVSNFLEPIMAVIASTATLHLTEIVVADPNAVLYLGQPAFLRVFHSVRNLNIQLSKRMDSPVDILPYLERLEIFEAHRLFLPIYPPDAHLPLTQTLHSLHLKCVSIQWMAERVFPHLEQSSIIFPHHADTIQVVDMPSCSYLKYDSNNLGTLRHFNLPPLARLEVKCGQWSSRRGNLQLMALYPTFSNGQSMSDLHLQVQCSEKMLVHILRLVPALKNLWLGLSFPHALRKAFFQAFIARRPDTSGVIGLPSQPIRPLCGQLNRLHLHYKEWLGGVEKTGMIQVFGDIVASAPAFSLHLSFDEGTKGQTWKVHKPVARLERKENHIWIGFSGLHGIVPLSTALDQRSFTSLLFKESEYLQVPNRVSLVNPFEFLIPLRNLRELRIRPLLLAIQSSTQLPSNLPIFRTLKVLCVDNIQLSVLAGRTFYSVKKYCDNGISDRYNLGQRQLIEMPVCTRLIVTLCSLATIKVPQIRELCIQFDHPEPNVIWEMHVAVNANLSGVRLMKVLDWAISPNIDLVKILRYLPALETLIIVWDPLALPSVAFFRAFAAMGTQGTAGLNNEIEEEYLPAALCPKLESLQIEDVDPTKHVGLMDVLREIVTVRAMVRTPLRSFTFMDSGRKWELIGMNGGFTVEEVIPAQVFELDI